MTVNEILAKMKETIVDRLEVNPSQITMESDFINDLGADSLGKFELVADLEELFDIDISEEAQDEILTVGDAVKYINKTLNA